ncbi:MAG: hypothetical protein ABI780_06140 [Ardenticatenales bacterium]
MMGNARVLGLVIGGAAIALFLTAVAWLFGARGDGTLTGGGFALGIMLATLVSLPLAGMAVLLVTRGRSDAVAAARSAKTRRLLDLVLTKGKVTIGEAVTELQLPREQVRAVLLDAVGRGLFSGFVNWNEGVLYAREAAAGVQPCPNCGGTIELAGRGVFQCPYCGTEIFLAVGEGASSIHGVAPPPAGTDAPSAVDTPPDDASDGFAPPAIEGTVPIDGDPRP